MLNQRRGQGLIETIIALPVLALALLIFCKIAYRQILFLVLDYHIHEALVCSYSNPLKICEKEFVKKVSPLLLSKEKLTIYLREDIAFLYGRSQLMLEPSLTIDKKMRKRL
jgi:hypothetical protein